MGNKRDRFDGISISFHWVVALAYFGLFAVGAYMVTLDYYNPLYTSLPYWHKALGVLLIGVFLARFVWQAFRSKPDALPTHKKHELIGANVAAWCMNIGLLVVLLSGYLITTSAGAGIDVFELFTLNAIDLGVNNQEDTAGLVHWVASYIVLGIATIHALAALKHHFIDKDKTLRRILPTFITNKKENS
jgi:cytochrome b561